MEHLIEDHDWFARRSLSSSDTEDVEILRSQGIPSVVEGITALAQALHIVPDTEDDRTEQTQSLLCIYVTPDHRSVTSQIAKQAKEKLSLRTLIMSLLLTFFSVSTCAPCSRRICLPYARKRLLRLRIRVYGFIGRYLINLRRGSGI